ncbi:hypothetical protein B0T10DRAFT_570359 [Thelonectria olida]|uniref:Uncharacterized protein n=1 Tax=Thelonectria olida TaxID=1576542 RepID=A0A9P9AX91_9HYPO|nr:hypothetical protein B0T10DRAFT_570359 [Thelonectria olida]
MVNTPDPLQRRLKGPPCHWRPCAMSPVPWGPPVEHGSTAHGAPPIRRPGPSPSSGPSPIRLHECIEVGLSHEELRMHCVQSGNAVSDLLNEAPSLPCKATTGSLHVTSPAQPSTAARKPRTLPGKMIAIAAFSQPTLTHIQYAECTCVMPLMRASIAPRDQSCLLHLMFPPNGNHLEPGLRPPFPSSSFLHSASHLSLLATVGKVVLAHPHGALSWVFGLSMGEQLGNFVMRSWSGHGSLTRVLFSSFFSPAGLKSPARLRCLLTVPCLPDPFSHLTTNSSSGGGLRAAGQCGFFPSC